MIGYHYTLAVLSQDIKARDPKQLLFIIDEMDAKIEQLEEENRLLRYHRFESSRDHEINPNQAGLFTDD